MIAADSQDAMDQQMGDGWRNMRSYLDLLMVIVTVLLMGLAYRVQTGRNPYWYPLLERVMALGFLCVSFVSLFVLPLSRQGALIYLIFYLTQVVLHIVLPGPIVEGLPLKNTNIRLKYKCNGLLSFMITLLLFFCGGILNIYRLSILYDHFLDLLAIVNMFSFFFSAALYLKGLFSKDKITANNFVENFWYGLELNPRIGNFDIKFFSESRPGLILWVLMNFSIAAAQFQKMGDTKITIPMILICLFHFIYVLDYFFVENYIVTTIDIIHERLGWMLLWGDYVWVPFFYVQQALYLYHFPRENSAFYNILNVAIFVIGYVIFRGSNRQKHKFKENPEGKIWGRPPKVIVTKYRTKLLTSGWWGLARHINYLGDLILAFSWGMTCGFESYIPYLYLVFMIGLLLHRFGRDDDKCREKYGDDWEKYCEAVPYKMIPYLW